MLTTAGEIDYIDLHPELQVLSFQPNEERVCFDVVIVDDQLSEGEENFTARITFTPTGVDIGSPETTIISISDNESKIEAKKDLQKASVCIYNCNFYCFNFILQCL